jgi:uncharacterized alpha-E superfamily protein
MLSRVADSCFWINRYIERAETNSRLLDVNMQLLLDFQDQEPNFVRKHWEPILATLEDQELFHEIFGERLNSDTVMEFVTFEPRNPASILSCVARARENARTIRELITSEMWEQLNKLYLYLRSPQARSDFNNSPFEFYQGIVEGVHLFHGTTDTTMTHGEGWFFMQVGRYLERADSTSRVLDMKYHIILPTGELVGGNVDLTQWNAVLRSCSGLEAYLKIYSGQVKAWEVARFLILHRSFPRSIRFCVDRMDMILHKISGVDERTFCNDAERLSGRLRSEMDFVSIEQIFQGGLHQYLDKTQRRLNDISNSFVEAYCDWLDTEQTEEAGQSQQSKKSDQNQKSTFSQSATS